MNNITKSFQFDIAFINLAVHGGAFHKIIATSEMLNEKGLRSIAIFSCEAPLGLQEGIDFDEHGTKSLCDGRVVFLKHHEMINFIQQTRVRLFIFDYIKIPFIGQLINEAKKNKDTETAQISFLFNAMPYWGVDYIFLPHPLTLWFILEQVQMPCAKDIVNAKNVFFIGNLLSEPICNMWTSSIRDKSSLFNKYNLNSNLPTCLFMPNRDDGKGTQFGNIIESVRNASINLLVKLHPWEYKNIRHEFNDYYGKGKTSADKWGIKALEEKDASWALSFCDFVIISGSSVGTEIPLWRKSVIYYSKRNWRTDIIKDILIRVNSKSSLSRVLTNREWEQFTDEHFERAIQAVHPVNLAPNGPMKTLVEKVELILSESFKKTNCIRNEQDLKKLYAPYLYQTKGWSGAPIKSIKDPINRVKRKIKKGLKQFISTKL